MDGALRNQRMDYFETAEKRSLVSGRIGGGIVGLSRLRFDGEDFTPVSPPDVEEAFLLHFHIRPQVAEISIDGRPLVPLRTEGGHVNILDFRQRYHGRIRRPFDMVGFHIPFTAFDTLAPEFRGRTVQGVRAHSRDGFDDAEIRGLGHALLPVFARPEEANRLFIDHVGWAVVAHFARRYAELRPIGRMRGPRLAPWQERRVKEMVDADLTGALRLTDLAGACGLSLGYFSRAFRATCGMRPHQWLLHRRVEHAKALLIETDLTVAAIASECGFSDQSHLTRMFVRTAGAPPALWRRERRPALLSRTGSPR